MAELLEKKCVPCEGGTTPLSSEDIVSYQKQLSKKWDVQEDKKISRDFECKDFLEAINFVNNVAEIAEREGHHPDIHIFYNKVRIDLWTHAIGGLSENDFIVAAKIEVL